MDSTNWDFIFILKGFWKRIRKLIAGLFLMIITSRKHYETEIKLRVYVIKAPLQWSTFKSPQKQN